MEIRKIPTENILKKGHIFTFEDRENQYMLELLFSKKLNKFTLELNGSLFKTTRTFPTILKFTQLLIEKYHLIKTTEYPVLS